MDAGFDRLKRRGLMSDDEQLTTAVRAFREEMEAIPRDGTAGLAALGDDLLASFRQVGVAAFCRLDPPHVLSSTDTL